MAASHLLRVFFALETDDRLRDRLAAVQQRLAGAVRDLDLVPREKLHLTVSFLGAQPPPLVSALADALDEAVGDLRPFGIDLDRVGAYGPPGSPRVLWVGPSTPGAPLLALHRRIMALQERFGVPVEARPFSPHITLARVASRRAPPALTSCLSSITFSPLGRLEVVRVLFMRSDLGSSGSRYDLLHGSPLKGT